MGLLFAAAGSGFLNHFYDRFAAFAGALLNPAQHLFLHAFDVFDIVICEYSPFLHQLAFGNVPVAFEFE